MSYIYTLEYFSILLSRLSFFLSNGCFFLSFFFFFFPLYIHTHTHVYTTTYTQPLTHTYIHIHVYTTTHTFLSLRVSPFRFSFFIYLSLYVSLSLSLSLDFCDFSSLFCHEYYVRIHEWTQKVYTKYISIFSLYMDVRSHRPCRL